MKRKKVLMGILGVVLSILAISLIYLMILRASDAAYEEGISDITSLTSADFRNVKSTLVNDSTISGLAEFCQKQDIVVKDWHTWYVSTNHEPAVAYQYVQAPNCDILMICGKTAWLVTIKEETCEMDDGQLYTDFYWEYSDPIEFRLF